MPPLRAGYRRSRLAGARTAWHGQSREKRWVAVDLLDSTGAVIATRTTDAAGAYLFGGLPPGDCLVRVLGTEAVLNGLALTGGVIGPFPVHLGLDWHPGDRQCGCHADGI